MAALFCVPVFAGNASRKPTFTKEVARILQKNCQVCHRPGEAGPFSMLTYEQTRPWAAAIREAVKTRKMPPWFADPQYGKFSNASALTQDEIDTLAAWVEAGAPKGDPDDMPAPMQFFEGWQIGKPDLVFELPKPFEVPASGMIDY
jgi:mono/diheme cytochrome c family protein